LVTDLLIAYPSGIPITTRRIPRTTYDHSGATVFVCTSELTAVLVDVTTLTEVVVLVAPGAVEVMVDVLVVAGTVEVVVLTEVAVVVVVAVVVEPDAVVVMVVVAVLDPVLIAVSGGTLNVANPVFGGWAESCEATMTSYVVAFTRVGSVAMLSGPVHTLVAAE